MPIVRKSSCNTSNIGYILTRMAELELVYGTKEFLQQVSILQDNDVSFEHIKYSDSLIRRAFCIPINKMFTRYWPMQYVKMVCPLCNAPNTSSGPFWCTFGVNKLHVYMCLVCKREGRVLDLLKEFFSCTYIQLHNWMRYGIFATSNKLTLEEIRSIDIQFFCRRSRLANLLKHNGYNTVGEFLDGSKAAIIKIRNIPELRYNQLLKDIESCIENDSISSI